MWLVIWSALKAVPWRRIAPYIVVGVIIASILARYYYLTVNLDAAELKIEALRARNEVYAVELTSAVVTIRKLDTAIQNQNSKIITLKESGDRMDELQARADMLAVEVAMAEFGLAVASNTIAEFTEQAQLLPVCDVYEGALIAIGGVE